MSLLTLARPARHAVPTMGNPPRATRPGTWTPGTAAQVRQAVTSASLAHATARFFADATPDTWALLLAAQVTAEAAA